MRHLTLAAFLMFIAVALGAFGAHALRPQLEALDRVDVWETAVVYHLTHGLAVMALALFRVTHPPAAASRLLGWSVNFWTGGILAFSGSLYILSLDGPRWLGPITPIGGVLLLAGWALVAIAALRMARKPRSGP